MVIFGVSYVPPVRPHGPVPLLPGERAAAARAARVPEGRVHGPRAGGEEPLQLHRPARERHDRRSGQRARDAAAGQAMAQRFSDWYFAIAVARYGEQASRDGLERACQLFAQGIASVENAAELEAWALGILDAELEGLDGAAGVDNGCRLTGNRLPSRLLLSAISEAECKGLPLLALTWSPRVSEDELRNAAEDAGGYPLAILQARYELKQWLGLKESVPFTELSNTANLDYLPLPLYESGRLPPEEVDAFERWMLSDGQLRQEVADFACFSLAMRAGALSGLVSAAPKPARRKSAETPRLSYEVPDASWSPEPWVVVFAACGLLAIALLLTMG